MAGGNNGGKQNDSSCHFALFCIPGASQLSNF